MPTSLLLLFLIKKGIFPCLSRQPLQKNFLHCLLNFYVFVSLVEMFIGMSDA